MSDVGLRQHRLGGGRVVSWVIAVLAAVEIGDALLRGTGRAQGAVVLFSLSVIGACYVVGMRPQVNELPSALVVKNPLRTATLPWVSITNVRTDDVVIVEAGELTVRCFALPRRNRPPLGSSVRSGIAGLRNDPSEKWQQPQVSSVVAAQILAARDALRSGVATGPATLTWDSIAVAVACISVVAALAACVLWVAA